MKRLWLCLLLNGLVPLQEEFEARFHGGVELAGNLPARSDFSIPGATRVLALAASEWQRLLIELPALALGTFQWLNGELRRAESCE